MFWTALATTVTEWNTTPPLFAPSHSLIHSHSARGTSTPHSLALTFIGLFTTPWCPCESWVASADFVTQKLWLHVCYYSFSLLWFLSLSIYAIRASQESSSLWWGVVSRQDLRVMSAFFRCYIQVQSCRYMTHLIQILIPCVQIWRKSPHLCFFLFTSMVTSSLLTTTVPSNIQWPSCLWIWFDLWNK